jgi:hypothetical protein
MAAPRGAKRSAGAVLGHYKNPILIRYLLFTAAQRGAKQSDVRFSKIFRTNLKTFTQINFSALITITANRVVYRILNIATIRSRPIFVTVTTVLT